MVTIGNLVIPNEMFFALMVGLPTLLYFFMRRFSNLNRVEILLCTPDGKEGRWFKGEDSLSENRVTIFRKMGRKTERLDFKRTKMPMQTYDGVRRRTLYKIFEGDGETSEWGKESEESKTAETTYENLAKFRNLINQLGAESFTGFKRNLSYILMGLFAGMALMMMLSSVLPAVF